MLQFLETLTGIEGLVPDPAFVGGGLHQIRPGGLVEVHADFSFHHALRLDRRINVLIYLNKDWRDEYGGHFELWDAEVTRAQKRILPLFNRCVIFSTTSKSFHGHPAPLSCPPGRNRKSLATFYYSNGRPEEEPHLTHRHPVAFQERPGVNRVKLTIRTKKALRALTPPLLADFIRRLRT
jgi:Rps23 Pro-64 3,4-dihydroxylase Tpa1-like proline 4-hydroxylase